MTLILMESFLILSCVPVFGQRATRLRLCGQSATGDILKEHLLEAVPPHCTTEVDR